MEGKERTKHSHKPRTTSPRLPDWNGYTSDLSSMQISKEELARKVASRQSSNLAIARAEMIEKREKGRSRSFSPELSAKLRASSSKTSEEVLADSTAALALAQKVQAEERDKKLHHYTEPNIQPFGSNNLSRSDYADPPTSDGVYHRNTSPSLSDTSQTDFLSQKQKKFNDYAEPQTTKDYLSLGHQRPSSTSPLSHQKTDDYRMKTEIKSKEFIPTSQENTDSYSAFSQTKTTQYRSLSELLASDYGLQHKSADYALGQQKPTDYALGSQQKPTDYALGSQQKPADYALGSQQKPTDYALGSQQKSADYALSSQQKPADYGSQQKPTDYALSQQKSNDFALNQLKSTDYASSSIMTSGYGSSQLKQSDYSLSQQKSSDFALSQQKASDFAMTHDKPSEYSMSKQKSGEYSVSQQKPSEYSLSQQKQSEYSLSQQKPSEYSLSQQKPSNYALDQSKSTDYALSNMMPSDYALSHPKSSDYSLSQQSASNLGGIGQQVGSDDYGILSQLRQSELMAYGQISSGASMAQFGQHDRDITSLTEHQSRGITALSQQKASDLMALSQTQDMSQSDLALRFPLTEEGWQHLNNTIQLVFKTCEALWQQLEDERDNRQKLHFQLQEQRNIITTLTAELLQIQDHQETILRELNTIRSAGLLSADRQISYQPTGRYQPPGYDPHCSPRVKPPPYKPRSGRFSPRPLAYSDSSLNAPPDMPLKDECRMSSMASPNIPRKVTQYLVYQGKSKSASQLDSGQDLQDYKREIASNVALLQMLKDYRISEG